MDVSAVRPPERIDASRAQPHERPPPPREPRPERDGPSPGSASGRRWMPPSTLKFALTAADVQARFEIHEATSTVTVTMYERETGEVLREVPSRQVLDVIASLAATGMRVDEVR